MKLNDKAGTTISISNICWCNRQDERDQSHGGLIVSFTGTFQVFEYDNEEALTADLDKIQRLIRYKDNSIVYSPSRENTGPR